MGCLKSSVADLLNIRKNPPPILLLPSVFPAGLAGGAGAVFTAAADFRSPPLLGEQFWLEPEAASSRPESEQDLLRTANKTGVVEWMASIRELLRRRSDVVDEDLDKNINKK